LTNNTAGQATAAAIDLDMLNELFENQKRLDDMFSSIFDDEDPFLTSTKSNSQETTEDRYQKIRSKENLLLNANTKGGFFTQKNRYITHFIMPLLIEIIIIYYSIMYFN